LLFSLIKEIYSDKIRYMSGKEIFIDPDKNSKRVKAEENQDIEILKEIEEQVNSNKTEYSKEMLHSKEGRSGVLLPIFVIASTLVLFAGTIALVWFFNSYSTTATITRDVSESGAINQIINKIREKAENDIKGKQDEIDQLLTNLESQTVLLQKEKLAVTTKVKKRKSNYEKEIEEKVSQKKAELVSQQIAEEEINRRVAEYEAQIRKEYNQKLLVYRESLEKDIKQKETQLSQLESNYKKRLEKNAVEIEKIKSAAAKQQREYDKQLIQTNAQIMKDIESVTTELADLQTKKEREKRLQQQLNGYYISVNNNINSGDLEAGRRTLNMMRSFMRSPTYLASSNLTASAESDLLVNELLQQYINMKEVEEGRKKVAEEFSYDKDPEYITMKNNFNQGIQRTKSAINKKNLDEALEQFNKSLSQLPSGVSAASVLKTLINENEREITEKLTLELSKQFETASSLDKSTFKEEFIAQIDELNQKIETLEQKATELKTKSSEDKKIIDKKDQEVKTLLKEIAKLEKEIESNAGMVGSAKFDRLSKKLKEAESERDQLKSKYSEATKSIASLKSQLTKKIDDSNNEVLKKVQDELTKRNAEISTIEKELTAVNKELSTLSTENQKLLAENSQLLTEKEKLLQEIAQKADLISTNRATIKELNDTINSLKIASANSTDNSEAQKIVEELSAIKSERDKYKENVDTLSTELTSALAQIKELKKADSSRVSKNGTKEIEALKAENQELLTTSEQLAAELKEIKEKNAASQMNATDMEKKLIELEMLKIDYDLIKKEYASLIKDYSRLNKSNPYALLTMENRFGNFFSSQSMNSFLPDFDEIFEDYTKTIRDQSSGQKNIYTAITNNIKEISSYTDKESMLNTIDELIAFERDNPFKVTMLEELKRLINEKVGVSLDS